VHDKPVDGVQIYDVPPVAVRVVEPPAHILTFDPVLIVGNGFTVTVTFDVLEQPLEFVPVTV
jgi:hypothetical protein